jgi:hypothetical protein
MLYTIPLHNCTVPFCSPIQPLTTISYNPIRNRTVNSFTISCVPLPLTHLAITATSYWNLNFIYKGPRMVLAGAGGVDHGKLCSLAEKYFAKVRGSKTVFRLLCQGKRGKNSVPVPWTLFWYGTDSESSFRCFHAKQSFLIFFYYFLPLIPEHKDNKLV